MRLGDVKQRTIRFLSHHIFQPFFKRRYKNHFKHLAPVDKNIYIKIEEIKGWYRGNRYSEISFPGIIKGGDWTSKTSLTKEIIEKSQKYHAILQRYKQGISWSKTDLFKERYVPQLEKGMAVKGYNDLESLKKFYHETYDKLFESLKESGLKPSTRSNSQIDPIYIIIDREGEILYTNDGNHRLYMCMLLGIEEIPVQVWMRHTEWQEKREMILEHKGKKFMETFKKFRSHPDIVSELQEDSSLEI